MIFVKQNLNLTEYVELVRPYFQLIREVQQKSFLNTVAVKDMLINNGVPIVLKPREKGSLMSDCIKTYLELALVNDENAKIFEISDIPVLLIGGKVLIRFNKMDDKFQASIQKRRGYWKFTNQGEELDGLKSDIVRMWAAFTPVDSQWSDIARYFMVCFDAGQVIWYNSLDDGYSVEQLSIDITPPKAPRRTKLKKTQEDDQQDVKTGTE